MFIFSVLEEDSGKEERGGQGQKHLTTDSHAHRVAQLSPSSQSHERSRLQSKASKAVDIVGLCRCWQQFPNRTRETIQSVPGPSTELFWSDCSRDERSGCQTTQVTARIFGAGGLSRVCWPLVVSVVFLLCPCPQHVMERISGPKSARDDSAASPSKRRCVATRSGSARSAQRHAS